MMLIPQLSLRNSKQIKDTFQAIPIQILDFIRTICRIVSCTKYCSTGPSLLKEG